MTHLSLEEVQKLSRGKYPSQATGIRSFTVIGRLYFVYAVSLTRLSGTVDDFSSGLVPKIRQMESNFTHSAFDK